MALDLAMQIEIEAVKNMRHLRKQDITHNGYTPTMEVDPETYEHPDAIAGELVLPYELRKKSRLRVSADFGVLGSVSCRFR